MKRTYRDSLADILNAANNARSFVEDVTPDDFSANKEK
jgi:uncharacterized protein with HEPN domain